MKGKMNNTISMLGLLLAGAMSSASAATITFNEYNLDPGQAVSYEFGSAATVNGYRVEAGDWYTGTGTAGEPLVIVNPLNTIPGGSVVASAYDDILLTAQDGGAFTLSGFDFSGAGELRLGLYRDASLQTLDYYIYDSADNDYAFESISLNTGLVYGVMFEHINGTSGSTDRLFALDNLHVSNLTAVPVPPALLMFVPGLLGLGMFARRSRAVK